MNVTEKRNELLSQSVMKKFDSRHFESYYCPTAAQAVEKALSLMPEGSSVSWGGSMTIREIGLTKAVHHGNYEVIDREEAKNDEEFQELLRKGISADFYLMSSNAISEDGVLVNIDGTGNRLAALSYSAKNVIVLASMTKIARDVDAAVKRARGTAAPINSMRFMGKTPCAKTGECYNCTSVDCICNQILITRNCRPAGRIKIILIGEDFGF